MRAEIDDHVPFFDYLAEIVALVDLSRDLDLGVRRRASQQRLAHPAFGTGNNDFNHFNPCYRLVRCLNCKDPLAKFSNYGDGSNFTGFRSFLGSLRASVDFWRSSARAEGGNLL